MWYVYTVHYAGTGEDKGRIEIWRKVPLNSALQIHALENELAVKHGYSLVITWLKLLHRTRRPLLMRLKK